MKVLVTKNISYAGMLNHSISKGEIVPVIEATNLPSSPDGKLYWVMNDRFKDCPIGMLLEPGDYTIVKPQCN